MSTVIRRRPLLRAVAIGGGAYLDGLVRIEAARLLEDLAMPERGDAGTDRVRFNHRVHDERSRRENG